MAAQAAKQLNPNVNILVYTDQVGIESEERFSCSFFKKLTGVANGLDNIDGRMSFWIPICVIEFGIDTENKI